MIIALSLILVVVIIASLPLWLPPLVVRLRIWVFTRVNGEDGVPVPGEAVDVSQFRKVYGSPAASGRSKGAALSDLFWYWLSPGPEMHQEHLENGPRYEAVAQATRQILAVSRKEAEADATWSAARILNELGMDKSRLARLRDLMMPIWADFYYGLVFEEECTPEIRELIVGNANDVVSALKMTKLRNMKKRYRLTRFLVRKLESGRLPQVLPEGFTTLERAYFLQGVFFNTAIVQMSEAMAHLLLFVAENPAVQAKLMQNLEDNRYLDQVIAESLRVNPLFGIAHRITTDEIIGSHGRKLPKGSVLCFNYQQFHHAGYDHPQEFRPERWGELSQHDENYMPFGMIGNRPCPAQAVALVTMRAAARETLRRFSIFSSVAHTRSIPNRGPCWLEPQGRSTQSSWRKTALYFMRVRDGWEDVGRSILQLFLGVFMVWDARRLRLCQKYFESIGSTMPDVKSEPAAKCPLHRLVRPLRSHHEHAGI